VGWNDDDSSDSGIESSGVGVDVAAARRELSPTAKTSRAWWKDKNVPPWELDTAHQREAIRQTIAVRPASKGDIRSEVASLQMHRASRTADRQLRPDGLTGAAQFERMQRLDSRLSDLQQRRQQRMSQRDGDTMRAGIGAESTARSLNFAAGSRRDARSSRLLATRHSLPSGATNASPDHHAEGVQNSLSQDLQNVRAKKAELEAKLASMQAQRASRSMQMSAESASRMGTSTVIQGEGSARVRAKRLHISLSAGPAYVGTSVPTKVLFDPTISVGAFDRLLRYVSFA
jgi:hypothetical protein